MKPFLPIVGVEEAIAATNSIGRCRGSFVEVSRGEALTTTYRCCGRDFLRTPGRRGIVQQCADCRAHCYKNPKHGLCRLPGAVRKRPVAS